MKIKERRNDNELRRRGYSVDVGIAYIGLADFLLHPDSLASL